MRSSTTRRRRLSPASFSTDSTAWARAHPLGYARRASLGRWQAARHLRLLASYAVELAARRIRKLMIFMPPRHGKSTFISHYFPGWYLGTFPNHDIILGAYEANFASTWGGKVRDSMAEFGPELWGLTTRADYRAASDWKLWGRDDEGFPVEGGMRTAGVGTGVTGRGGHLIGVDDPIKDAAQANSASYRKTLWDWWQSTLYTRREPNAVMFVMHTRWHQQDLAGMLLENEGRAEEGGEWTVISLPALCDDPDTDLLGRDFGEALWPERWPREALLEIKNSISPYWWGALYQQRPAPAEGNIFKRRWWKFWRPRGADLPPPVIDLPGDEGQHTAEVIDLPASFSWEGFSWDLAFKKGKATSYVVGQAWKRKEGMAFLMGQTRRRMDFPETLKEFVRFSNAYPGIERKLVEDAANAAALVAVLRRKIPGIVLVSVRGSKEERARAVSAYPEAGNVYLPHPALNPWVHGFIDRLAAHPHGDDDEGDATSQALASMFRGTVYDVNDLNIIQR